MIINLCLACRRVNALDALRCHACGATLELQDDRPPVPAHAPTMAPAAGAIELAEVLSRPAAAPVRPSRSPAPLMYAPAAPVSIPEPATPARRARSSPGELVLTLRNLELPPRPDRIRLAAPMLTEELIYSDPRPRIAPPEPPAVHAQRADRRAHVRRARLRQTATGRGAHPSEVLVLDPDGRTRDTLCGLLRDWGFGVHAVAAPAEAAGVVANRSLAAAFIDVPLDSRDGGAGVDLCRRVRDQNRRRGQEATVLVLLARHLHPMDRVRAELAGCDDTLLKPVTRGGVARVLDARGVPMPQDARRTA